MLNTDIHPLLDVAVADDLVDDNADCTGRDIVDDTSPAMIRLNLAMYSCTRDAVRTRGSICGACPFAERRSP